VSASGLTAPVVVLALIGLFVSLTVLIFIATGALTGANHKESDVIRRLSVYSVAGKQPQQISVTEQAGTGLGDSALARSAVGLMNRVARTGQMERALDSRLEAAGLPLRTAEWMLLHVGSAVGAALLLLLASRGQVAGMLVGLLLGLIIPWLVLGVAKSRRENRFLSQLPDTLQLLAGSLAAGYSLPQAMDSVVRESHPPISGEFNRALVETRLGMLPEDALDGIANRTASRDFSWIVMAIRIQRDVGGNLAELLGTVADTLRERERLRRQVSALSAEGRLSGLILGALPIVFALYLIIARPDYISPLFNTPLGLMLLIVGVVTLIIGGVWMAKVIKVEV
jgi:tight adherence protein B